ncbi:MAG: erythritol transport system substrate-binding protein [Streptosporangiaceae bacterium]|jgi:erythritol transport system substrate-binding protein|nr:Erythritol transport system substrate-binding protein [Streptosporangiaceae bacterium]MDX6435064.1 erythritol transport system substrate-binding protein [Streptosporangiaceae bacterium]
MIFRPASAALSLALIFGLAACGSSGGSKAAASGGKAGGTFAVITVDPSNPYWKAEVDTAQSEAKKLGYSTTVNAHGNDPDKQNQFIDAAISQKVKAIILDPAGAKESVGAVQKATNAGIPVFLVNAEINTQGIAKSQIVSNNAQGATLGAQEWVKAMGSKGNYVELYGNPTDNNAKVRSDAYAAVISQYPGLKEVQRETANWDRQQGKDKMELLIRAHPDLTGVIAGNDEMALGAIQALKTAGKLSKVKVLGFDGNNDAAKAVANGEMVATALQPIVTGTTLAVDQADRFLKTGKSGAAQEKQAINCVLITKDNAAKLNNFVLAQ